MIDYIIYTFLNVERYLVHEYNIFNRSLINYPIIRCITYGLLVLTLIIIIVHLNYNLFDKFAEYKVYYIGKIDEEHIPNISVHLNMNINDVSHSISMNEFKNEINNQIEEINNKRKIDYRNTLRMKQTKWVYFKIYFGLLLFVIIQFTKLIWVFIISIITFTTYVRILMLTYLIIYLILAFFSSYNDYYNYYKSGAELNYIRLPNSTIYYQRLDL